MSRVSTYLNFMGETEEAFAFYSSVFGTQISGEIARMGDMPTGPGTPELSEPERNLVAHVELPILAGHVLMGTDMLESMGHELKVGNNVTICLEPDSRAETDRLYRALSEGGTESTGMQQMPWAYWGCSLDRFGIRWMFNCYEPAPKAPEPTPPALERLRARSETMRRLPTRASRSRITAWGTRHLSTTTAESSVTIRA